MNLAFSTFLLLNRTEMIKTKHNISSEGNYPTSQTLQSPQTKQNDQQIVISVLI